MSNILDHYIGSLENEIPIESTFCDRCGDLVFEFPEFVVDAINTSIPMDVEHECEVED